MRPLTKAEACRELAVSLSTLDRRIASGEIQVRREPHGRRHRVYVMLDGELPENGANAKSQGTLPDVAQERIRGLEKQVGFLQRQLELEQQRNPASTSEDAYCKLEMAYSDAPHVDRRVVGPHG